MRERHLALVSLILLLAPARAQDRAAAAPRSDYAIVVSEATRQRWRAAVDALQRKHSARILSYAGDVLAVHAELAALHPRYACFVAQPAEAGRAFVIAVHRLTRTLDADPYGDCVWGILTGYEEADLLRAIADPPELRIRSAAAGTSLPLELFESGAAWSEIQPGLSWRKAPNGPVETREGGAADSTAALVAALNGPAQYFVTSGHATQHDWQLGFRYRNGQLRCAQGRIFGLDLEGKKHAVEHPGPRIYSAAGNCLMGWIEDRESIALAWMHGAGVRQMTGYTANTWYGWAGWGVNAYFHLGTHDFATSFFLNTQALLQRLHALHPETAKKCPGAEEFDPGMDALKRFFAAHGLDGEHAAGLLWDRDTLAFYGDPALRAVIDRQTPAPYRQRLTREGDVLTFAVETLEAGTWDRPPAMLLPARMGAATVLEEPGQTPALITDDFVLLLLEGDFARGEVHRVRWRAEGR